MLFKALSIALGSTLLSYADAAACNPAYASGSTYAVGDGVSVSVTTTTPVVYTPCSTPGVGTCTAAGFVLTGGVSTTATYNYACSSEYWCSNSGFAPGGTYSEYAWTKDTTACTVSFILFSTHFRSVDNSIVSSCRTSWSLTLLPFY